MAPRIPKQNTRFINPQAESSRGRSALEALRGYAGAPSQASVMYPGALSAYEGGELAGMAEMLIPGASLAKGALGAALAGVIKPRGGNWLEGSVENALGGLKRYSDDNEMEMFRGLVSNREKELMDLNQQRVATLDRLRAEGQPDSVIDLVDAEFTGKIDQANQLLSGNLEEMAKLDRNASLNRWIEGPLTRYIKRDLATPEDPVRRLAEEGVVHYFPEIDTNSPTLRELRSSAGFPPEGFGRSEAARQWEAMSDMQPTVRMGRDFPEGIASFMDEETLADNPWLTKLGPDDNVYSFNKRYPPNQALGFDHLVDELNNALNPESGLPRNLLLSPEQMQQMGMEKAVRHVDAINKWRAAQQAAANAELANKAMVVREYPDTPEMPNPKGLRWVELKKEDDVLPEGYSVVPDARNSRYWDQPDEHYFHVMSPSGEIVSTGATEKEALGLLNRDKKIEALRKQLKYEGDTMGHCVGGYCDDVLEGNSRIFSLRDAKGEPHVTVEVAPPGRGPSAWIPEDEEHPVMWPDIIQIKGKGNQAPKDEYLPFVQDFVRNSPLGGTWGDVGDLGNARLHRLEDESGIKYLTPEEYHLPRKKEGGLVAQPDYFDDLDAFLRR